MDTVKQAVLARLRGEILSLGGLPAPVQQTRLSGGLEGLRPHFPHGSFPKGAVHEFLCRQPEEVASSIGFVSGLLSTCLGSSGVVLWVCQAHQVYPPALVSFRLAPHQVIFVSATQQRQAAWVLEEALRCSSLTAVVADLGQLDFTLSRRLQLAVEHSRTTGFVLNTAARPAASTACVSRWRVQALPSQWQDWLPGVGRPRWQVQLLKMRNGKPGSWQVEWGHNGFRVLLPVADVQPLATVPRKAG
jgi:protein ImuA